MSADNAGLGAKFGTGARGRGAERAGAEAFECVVMGGSAGSIEALLNVLPKLPASFPLPIVVVVHLPAEEKSLLTSIFAARCAMQVKEVEDKEVLRGGTVYFAPPNYHVLVEADFSLSLSSDEPVLFSRPSIDVLFESAADAYGSALLGVLLTGASSDGAAGLKAISEAGGVVVVQDPATAEASLMPRSGLEACPTARALLLESLVSELCSAAGGRRTQP